MDHQDPQDLRMTHNFRLKIFLAFFNLKTMSSPRPIEKDFDRVPFASRDYSCRTPVENLTLVFGTFISDDSRNSMEAFLSEVSRRLESLQSENIRLE